MRQYYIHEENENIAIEVISMSDGKSEKQIHAPISDAQALVDNGEAVIYNTHSKLKEAVAYAVSRRDAYPEVEEQLDQIYHEGIDAWKGTIKAVKDAHPKPE